MVKITCKSQESPLHNTPIEGNAINLVSPDMTFTTELHMQNKHLDPVYTGPDKSLHGQKLAQFHLTFTRDRRNWTNF